VPSAAARARTPQTPRCANRKQQDSLGNLGGWKYTHADGAKEQSEKMKIGSFIRCFCFGLILTSFCAQAEAADQPAVKSTKIESAVPAGNAYIVKYCVDKPSSGSGYETGSLHIIYSDKTEIIEKLRPKAKSTEQTTVYNQEGIAKVKLALDKRTIGWEESFDNCCTSYSIPLVLAIYRSGRTILHIQQGQMLWYWTFRDGGKQVAAVWGTTHGPSVGDYQLYDVETGRMVSEVFGDPATQSLSADAPEWAKETERQKSRQN
jgi:hypothetical protein